MDGSLSLQQAPPLSVPASFFLTAPLFGIFAAVILLFDGSLLTSRWTPGALALTHCLVLGFFTTVMIGALQQLLPVIAGAVIQRPRLKAAIVWCLWVPGVLFLIGAFMSPSPLLFALAALLLAGAVLTFVVIVYQAMRGCESVNDSVPGIRAAIMAFMVTLLLGVTLVMGYVGLLPLWRIPLTNLHLSWGLIGWIGALIMAIAWQVVPLFQITPPYPERIRRSTVPFVLTLLLAKSMLTLADQGPNLSRLELILDVTIAGYLLGFAISTLVLQKNARRKIRDSHRTYWRLAMLNLILALVLWVFAQFSGEPRYELMTAIIFLLGFAMPVVIGMLLKIMSFLVWLHLQTLNDSLELRGEERIDIPRMKSVIAPRTSDRLLILLVIAQISIVVAVLLPGPVVQVSAMLWLGVFVSLLAIMARACYRYRVLHKSMSGAR